MAFNGKEGEQISLEEAVALTTNYRNSPEANGAQAHFFGKSIIGNILAQTGCVGIRIYYGLDANGMKQLVMVGVAENGDDMYNGIIADRSIPCPTYCSGGGSPL
jgi:hypothetical protein